MRVFITAILAFTLFASCQKEQVTTENSSVTTVDADIVSLVQESTKLRNEAGEEITVTYFAQGSDVAVKIQKDGEAEQILLAKKVSAKGDPVFTNDKMMWEGSIGMGGKLSDAAGNSSQYLEIEK